MRRLVTVMDLADNQRYALNGGPFGSKLVSSMYVAEGVPVIRGTNLPFDRRFSFDDFVYVSPEKAEELSANTARPGDIVFTQRGTLGQIGIIPKNSVLDRFIISQSQMKLTVGSNIADAEYIYYYFRQPEVIRKIESLASSSGVPHINLQTLREFLLEIPCLDEQRIVASISPPTTTSSRTTRGGSRSWRRWRGAFSRNGSSISAPLAARACRWSRAPSDPCHGDGRSESSASLHRLIPSKSAQGIRRPKSTTLT